MRLEGQVMTSDNAVGTAIINIGGTDITFAVTHLSTIQSERDLQITYALENIFEPIKRPVVLGGDFNATPSNSTIAILDAAGFTRTNTDPTKFTIPSNNPNRSWDYITYLSQRQVSGRFSHGHYRCECFGSPAHYLGFGNKTLITIIV